MTWTPLAPIAAAADPAMSPVRIACNMGIKERNPTALIIVRPSLLQGLAWWMPGAKVSVETGSGDDANLLRIKPGAGFTLRKTPGGGGSVILRLCQLPGWRPTSQKPTAVDYDWSDEWLIVTLPTWARPLPVPAKAAFKVGARDGLADRHVPNGGLPNGGIAA